MLVTSVVSEGDTGRGDVGTRELGDVATHFYRLFNFSSYYTKSSSVDRNCVVPRFYVPRLYDVKQRCSKYI